MVISIAAGGASRVQATASTPSRSALDDQGVAEQPRPERPVAGDLARHDHADARVADAGEQRDECVVERVLAVALRRERAAEQRHGRDVDQAVDHLTRHEEQDVAPDAQAFHAVHGVLSAWRGRERGGCHPDSPPVAFVPTW
jgi:hypothetical protein